MSYDSDLDTAPDFSELVRETRFLTLDECKHIAQQQHLYFAGGSFYPDLDVIFRYIENRDRLVQVGKQFAYVGGIPRMQVVFHMMHAIVTEIAARDRWGEPFTPAEFMAKLTFAWDGVGGWRA